MKNKQRKRGQTSQSGMGFKQALGSAFASRLSEFYWLMVDSSEEKMEQEIIESTIKPVVILSLTALPFFLSPIKQPLLFSVESIIVGGCLLVKGWMAWNHEPDRNYKSKKWKGGSGSRFHGSSILPALETDSWSAATIRNQVKNTKDYAADQENIGFD